MSHSSSADGQVWSDKLHFSADKKSRNLIPSLFNEQELFEYFISVESKLHSHKSRWHWCWSLLRTQHMMLNCCMFNVIFLRNKNTIIFLNIIIRKEVYFHNLQVAHKLIWRCKLNSVMPAQSTLAKHANVSHFLEPFCILKSSGFCLNGVFFDTQFVRNYFYSSLMFALWL